MKITARISLVTEQYKASEALVLPVLAQRFTVVAPDLLGHGESARLSQALLRDRMLPAATEQVKTARDAYAAGESHVLWGTLDMMVLFAESLMRDSRTAPRVFQQVDWSSGGDGIVVRDAIKSVRDLKGKTIVYAQNSPSQYYINNLLLTAGIQPGDVKHRYTATAFEAAADQLADLMFDFLRLDRRDRIAQRNRVESASEHFDWSNLSRYYAQAHDLALREAARLEGGAADGGRSGLSAE
jgi:pimeloyl-ACP methyl ester carboxylesterase